MFGRIATFAGVLIGALWLASGSSQAEGEVDCDSTALSLPAEFEAKCSTFSQPVHFSGESSAGPGTVYVEIMEASNMKAGVYLVVLSARLTATRFGYGSDSIKKILASFFRLCQCLNTQPLATVAGLKLRNLFPVATNASLGNGTSTSPSVSIRGWSLGSDAPRSVESRFIPRWRSWKLLENKTFRGANLAISLAALRGRSRALRASLDNKSEGALI